MTGHLMAAEMAEQPAVLARLHQHRTGAGGARDKALVIEGMVAFAGNLAGTGGRLAGVRSSVAGQGMRGGVARRQQRCHRRGPAAHVTQPSHAP